jgi:predicted phage terminase large subunit-like protein
MAVDYDRLCNQILKVIGEKPNDLGAYEDLMNVCKDMKKNGCEKQAHGFNKQMRQLIGRNAQNEVKNGELRKAYKDSLLFDAPVSLDAYMLYLEIERAPQERFYQPRRRVLYPAVSMMQQLADDKLDEAFISCPPRVGKTTLLMFLTTWLMGKNSEMANLYSAYSDVITNAFYQGVLEIINDPNTYLWAEVFPKCKIVQTNAQNETINLDRKKRYPSLTCRSLYGTLNGACDCSGFLISDDLIGGIEEALSRDRMMSAWLKVDNNLITRAKGSAKILWCGTRWSMIDPAGLRMELLTNDQRFQTRRHKIINMPALNEKGNSNFVYDYGVGFTTEYYQQRRASFERNGDMASWNAQYMGQPVEREGTLFAPEDMRFYNGQLPMEDPERTFMVVDPAFGGSDFVAAPVCYQYGEDVYVVDVVYDSGDKRVTQPLLAATAQKYGVQSMRIEANKTTEAYKEGVEEEIKRRGYRVTMTSKAAPPMSSKENRIRDKAPDIRLHFIFLEDGLRSKGYSAFMQNVYSFKLTGKNKHDDAPDSLAMAADFAFGIQRRVTIFHRTF